MSETQADRCAARYGFTNPTTIQVKCPCEGCVGHLTLEGENVTATLGFLVCGECGCCHCIETTHVESSSVKERSLLTAQAEYAELKAKRPV